MSTPTKARIGRPFNKPAPKGSRVQLGLIVAAEIKHRINSAAIASGRTQSQQVEYFIKRYDLLALGRANK